MGCVIGKPKLTDEELDFIARSTNQSRDIVEKQYRNFHEKNPGANLSKWDFRNKNSVHQIMNPRRVPIIDAMTRSAHCRSAKPRDHNIL